MKIALILVLGLSMALALTEESPEEIKSAVTGIGTGGSADGTGVLKLKARQHADLEIRSYEGMGYRQSQVILGFVEDALYRNDDNEGIARDTYRAIDRRYGSRYQKWACVAGTDWHAYSSMEKKILVKDNDSELFVFCFQ